jgi:hypothetical protein
MRSESAQYPMPRFVLLYHECPPDFERASHWDFMLEVGEVLRTWAVAQLPAPWHAAYLRTRGLHPGCARAATINEVEAEQLGAHRRDYLEYEGPVSGGRGQVVRIDQGTYSTKVELPLRWTVALAGALLCGTVELQQIAEWQSSWKLRIHTED